MLATLDWQGIATVIAAVGAALATVIGALNRRSIQTPSGDPIGKVAERTHDLAAVATMSTMGAVSQAGAETPPAVQAGAGLDRAVERLNADPTGAVKVNGEELRS